MISLRLRNWALYDWCAIILPLVNDPNGVSADDFGIQNPYIHIAFFMTISLEKCDVTVYTYSPFAKKGRIQIFYHEFRAIVFLSSTSGHVVLGQVTVKNREIFEIHGNEIWTQPN